MKRNSLEKVRFGIDEHSQFSVASGEMDLIVCLIVVASDPSKSIDAQPFEKIEAKCVHTGIKALSFMHS